MKFAADPLSILILSVILVLLLSMSLFGFVQNAFASHKAGHEGPAEDLTVVLNENVSITDIVTTFHDSQPQAFEISLVETMEINDLVDSSTSHNISLFEVVLASDSFISSTDFKISFTEQVNIIDQEDTKSTFFVDIVETININDLVTSSIFTLPQTFAISLTETVNMIDTITTSLFTLPQAFAISLDEGIDIIDGVESSTFTVPQTFVIGLSENVEVGDIIILVSEVPPSTNFTKFLLEQINVNDSVLVATSGPTSDPNNFFIKMTELVIVSDIIEGITPTKIIIVAKIDNGRPKLDPAPEIVKFSINGTTYNDLPFHKVVNDEFFIGTPINFAFEILENSGAKHVKMIQLALGLPVDDYISQADTRIILYYSGTTNRSESIILDKNDSIENVTTSIVIGDKLTYVNFTLTPTKAMEHKKLGLQVTDDRGNGKQFYLQGMGIIDPSPPEFDKITLEPEKCKVVISLKRDWCGWADYLENQGVQAMNYLRSIATLEKEYHTHSLEEIIIKNLHSPIVNYYPWEHGQ